MPDVQAEAGQNIYVEAGFASVDISVSNPATSSHIRLGNKSDEILRLVISMIEGVPKRADPGPTPPSAVGVFDIRPGGQFTVAFHIPYGGGAAQNTWRTNFSLLPTAAGTALRARHFQLTLVNAPGRSGTTAGDNLCTVQFRRT